MTERDKPGLSIDCQGVVELVTEYLEGTIAEVERERVEAHLGDCPWCERYIRQTRMLIAALGRLEGDPAANPKAWDQALDAFRAARS